jgi:hypothetical protein
MQDLNFIYPQKFIDQMGNEIVLKEKPRRIISLVPSQTELLHYLGLENEVIGITKFCIHPENWFKTKTRIGGTKTINIEKVKQLKPDLIIGNKEENVQSQIEELQKYFPVWMSDIYSLKDAYRMIECIGNVTDTTKDSSVLVNAIQQGFESIKNKVASQNKLVYLIWNNPLITVGSNTFINYILNEIGFENAMKENRYPVITSVYLKTLNPHFIFLSSEPFPFKEKHIKELQKILPYAKILLVDGEMFSWYGSRLLQAPKYFNELLNGFQPLNNLPL